MPIQPPIVAVEGVTFSFDGLNPVVEDATFTIERGDFASMIGPNGGGKTTLLKLLLGLLEPAAGSIRVFGESPHRARRRIGYMPQYAALDRQFPITVQEVVLTGRLTPDRRWGGHRAADRRAAAETLDRVGLGSLARRPFAALSGGQRQRVLLARALVSSPELLLLDEPAAGLDRRVEQDFFALLEELNRDTTVLLVSHDLGFVRSFVRTVVCVHRRVALHPTAALDGRTIHELYGGEVRAVHHHLVEPH